MSAPVLLGETDPCGVVSESSIQAGFENSLEDADFAVAGAENDFHDAQVVVPAGAGFFCRLQDDFAVVKSRTLGISGSRGEVNLSGAQLLPGAGLLGTGTSRYDPKRGRREVANLVTMRPSSSLVSSAVGRRRCRAQVARVLPPAAGETQCNEAGSSLDFASIRVENPSSRVARVTSALHNLCLVHSSSIPAHKSHPRMSHVVNSVGDTEDGRAGDRSQWVFISSLLLDGTGWRPPLSGGAAFSLFLFMVVLLASLLLWAGAALSLSPCGWCCFFLPSFFIGVVLFFLPPPPLSGALLCCLMKLGP